MQTHQRAGIIPAIAGLVGILGVTTFSTLPGLAEPGMNGSGMNGSSQNSTQTTPTQTTPTQTTPTQTTPADTTPRTDAPGSTRTGDSLTTLDRQFMLQAAHSDQTEIQTSRLALQKSRSQAVRSFAQRMIQEHTKSTQQLKQIAQQKGVTLPTDVGAENQPLLSQLKKLSGTAFDQAYMTGQVQAHNKTEQRFKAYLRQGQDPQLKTFASRIEPIVAEHLQMARSMVARR